MVGVTYAPVRVAGRIIIKIIQLAEDTSQIVSRAQKLNMQYR